MSRKWNYGRTLIWMEIQCEMTIWWKGWLYICRFECWMKWMLTGVVRWLQHNRCASLCWKFCQDMDALIFFRIFGFKIQLCMCALCSVAGIDERRHRGTCIWAIMDTMYAFRCMRSMEMNAFKDEEWMHPTKYGIYSMTKQNNPEMSSFNVIISPNIGFHSKWMRSMTCKENI